MISIVVVLLSSVALLFVHIFTQGMLATRDFGLKWNFGTRDGASQPQSVMANRAARASNNYRETYPAFIALWLLTFLAGFMDVGNVYPSAVIAAWVWLIARALYLPAYLSGVPYLRPVTWMASLAALGWMAIADLLMFMWMAEVV